MTDSPVDPVVAGVIRKTTGAWNGARLYGDSLEKAGVSSPISHPSRPHGRPSRGSRATRDNIVGLERGFEIAGYRFRYRPTMPNIFDRTNLIRPAGGPGVSRSAHEPGFTVYDAPVVSFRCLWFRPSR